MGISLSKKKFNELTKENKTAIVKKKEKEKKEPTKQELDSIKKVVSDELDNVFIPISEKTKKEILEKVEEAEKDTTAIKIGRGNTISFGSDTKLDKFYGFQKKYPDASIDEALDSLKYEKNFTNRFFYTKVKTGESMFKKENRDKFLSELLSYASISLFIFLPIFTIFLKLFYVRRKYTYVDHLIFVFHTQTVLFMLLTIITFIDIFVTTKSWWIFIIIFLMYLFLAMKKFYQQGFFKTFIKFLLLNIFYFFMASIGIVVVGLVSFMLY